MTEAGARKGLEWWPQLVLWGTVIAVGALYLVSVERHREDARSRAAGQGASPPALAVEEATTRRAPAPVPAPLPAAAPGPVFEASGAVGAGPAMAGDVPALQVALPAGQVQAPEAQPFAPASVVRQAGSAPAAEVERRPTAPLAVPGTGLPAPMSPAPPSADPGIASRPAPAEAASATEAPSPMTPALVAALDVSPAEARAIASAVTEAPLADEAQPEPGPTAAPGPGETKGVQPPAQQTPREGPAQAAGQLERARILSEYEALRRAAEADQARLGGWAPGGPYGHLPYGGQYPFPAPSPYGALVPVPGFVPVYPGW